MPINRKQMGNAIKRLRVRAGMEQTELAEGSGVAASQISRIENGHVMPGPETQIKIATGLGVTWAELIAEYEGIEISVGDGRVHESATDLPVRGMQPRTVRRILEELARMIDGSDDRGK